MTMETKICTKCGVEKVVDGFPVEYPRGRVAPYVRNQCRACRLIKRTPKQARAVREKVLENNPLYDVWSNMKARCDNIKNKRYSRYGGRGIKYCDKWAKYKNFEEEMLGGYKKGLQLDRINNNDGYHKENCRWATAKEQARNKSNTRLVEHNGKKMILADWAKELGIKHATLKQRFYCYKYTGDKLFNI